MKQSLKICTVTLMCLAFIFRLLLPGSIFLGSQTEDNAHGKELSQLTKNGHYSELSSQAQSRVYSIAELCEERSENEEDFSKLKSPQLISFLNTALAIQSFVPRPNHSFDLIKSELHSKKYLAISILRI